MRTMLALEETIIDMHDDYTPWADVSVGFDDDKSLHIVYYHEDYQDNIFYNLRAVVTLENAWKFAQALNTTLTDIPAELMKRLGDTSHQARLQEVLDTFYAIISLLKSHHIEHQVKKEPLQPDQSDD